MERKHYIIRDPFGNETQKDSLGIDINLLRSKLKSEGYTLKDITDEVNLVKEKIKNYKGYRNWSNY